MNLYLVARLPLALPNESYVADDVTFPGLADIAFPSTAEFRPPNPDRVAIT